MSAFQEFYFSQSTQRGYTHFNELSFLLTRRACPRAAAPTAPTLLPPKL